MRSVALLVLISLSACVTQTRTHETKEVFVEPFRDADYELARLSRLVPFPLDPKEQPRAYSLARPFAAQDERLDRVANLLASELDHEERRDAREEEKPPTSLILPDRSDFRATSACYVAHCAFLARSGPGIIHHVSVLVVNREAARVSVPVVSLLLVGDSDQKTRNASMPLLAAATDRGVRILDAIEVPRGEQRLAHFFFEEVGHVSPVLQLRWSATVEDVRGGPSRELPFRAELVRRYLADKAPLSALEDKIARGLYDLPSPNGARSDWVDPGLTAVPGSGK